jgi:hypothetical protein
MVLARRIGAAIGHESIVDAPGAYLLGATTPDIRVITRQDRFSTHYFDLNEHSHQDSVSNFFAMHPRLSDAGNVPAATLPFVAGYISHLVMDEQYITGVYRPFFAKHDELGGTIRANVMDRLLQFDLDRAYGNDPEVKQHLCTALAGAVENIEAGFVEDETLERWRLVTLDVAAREMDWERMRGMISNHLRYSGLEEGETLTSFLDSLPELLDATIAHITSAEIDAFVERSTEAARAAVARYLGCG